MKRYSRLIVLLGGAFSCVAINVALIMSGHYRLPLVVFVAYLVGAPLIIRKLPPVTTDPQQIRSLQSRGASSARRLGWIYVAGLILGSIDLLSEGTHGMPWWGVLLAMSWSGFLIWSCFRLASRFKKAAASQPAEPAQESKQI